MIKFKVNTDVESPFWLGRLILHGITTLVTLTAIITSVCLIAAVSMTKLSMLFGVALAAPAAAAFCYHLPHFIFVLVGQDHRGLPPYVVLVFDTVFFLAFMCVTIYFGAGGLFSHAFNEIDVDVYFARGCVISAPFLTVAQFILIAIGAYDIVVLRRTRKNQVYIVTGYQSANDLSNGIDHGSRPTSHLLAPPPTAQTYRGYHSRDRSLDNDETHALHHQPATVV
ncbi:hypothetical protein HJFPF1_03107 [Paramyrothecium foliicola]|nr:hypothetical protein HJFPF1_03107 [Paramyrothecium foliicola]